MQQRRGTALTDGLVQINPRLPVPGFDLGKDEGCIISACACSCIAV